MWKKLKSWCAGLLALAALTLGLGTAEMVRADTVTLPPVHITCNGCMTRVPLDEYMLFGDISSNFMMAFAQYGTMYHQVEQPAYFTVAELWDSRCNLSNAAVTGTTNNYSNPDTQIAKAQTLLNTIKAGNAGVGGRWFDGLGTVNGYFGTTYDTGKAMTIIWANGSRSTFLLHGTSLPAATIERIAQGEPAPSQQGTGCAM